MGCSRTPRVPLQTVLCLHYSKVIFLLGFLATDTQELHAVPAYFGIGLRGAAVAVAAVAAVASVRCADGPNLNNY